jgi:LysM repeat protein
MEVKIYNYNTSFDVFYTVQKLDTLESIAKNFGITKDYILSNNQNCLYEGQVLFFPETHLKTYVVKPFDTLQKIAETNSCTIENIIQKNALKNEYIFVGQKLYL